MRSLLLLSLIPPRPESQMELIIPFLQGILDLKSMMDKHIIRRANLLSILHISRHSQCKSIRPTSSISQNVSKPSNTKSAWGSFSCSFVTVKIVLNAQSASPTPTHQLRARKIGNRHTLYSPLVEGFEWIWDLAKSLQLDMRLSGDFTFLPIRLDILKLVG
jgi:hypothetical protein